MKGRDFIGRISGLEFSEQQFLDDLIDPLLPIRFVGDVILVAENLTQDGATEFVSGLLELTQPALFPSDAELVVQRVAEMLELDNA